MSSEPGALSMPLLLVVEDEYLIREMLVDALTEAGYSTLVSGDGEAAVLLFEENRNKIRGLVTDINLGKGMDGWEVARGARENTGDLPVVYLSGASGHEWTSRGVPNSLMISKPFAPAQVVVAISSLLVSSDATA